MIFALPQSNDDSSKPIYRYVVRYGLCGRVGRFGTIRPIECERGEQVVVHTDRGIEAGELLIPHTELASSDTQPPTGELLRRMTREDHKVLTALRGRTNTVLSRCEKLLSERSAKISVVDGETLLDGRTTILYFLGQADETLGPVAVELTDDPRWRIRFEPLVVPDSTEGTAPDSHLTAAGADTMKGPYERLKYDFRRTWECPLCKRRERTEGSVTTRMCACREREGGAPISMRMVEDGPRRPQPSRPRFPPLPEGIWPDQPRKAASPPPSVPSPALPQTSPVSQVEAGESAVRLEPTATPPPADPMP